MRGEGRLAGRASRGRSGAAAGWLAGSVLVHAGLGLALARLPASLPQEVPDRRVALIWSEQGEGAGDAADSTGMAAAADPVPAAQASRDAPEAEAADAAPLAQPAEPDQAALPDPAEGMAPPDTTLPLPPPAAPRPPASPASPPRQAAAPAPAPTAPAGPAAAAPAPPQAAGGIEVSGAVRPPRQLGGSFNAPPAYPSASRMRNEQGRVTLMVEISAAGQVTDAAVQVSAGYPALDRAALEAVRTWRFEPALRDGQPVQFVTSLHISFQLEGGLRW